MTFEFVHESYAGLTRQTAQPGTDGSKAPAVATGYQRVLLRADRACCCSAKPAVIAILPPVPSRMHRTELLFCMHHYRAARAGLLAAGATVVDASGRVLSLQEGAAFAASC